jgi:lauroyl/myristoyl acyltransferase
VSLGPSTLPPAEDSAAAAVAAAAAASGQAHLLLQLVQQQHLQMVRPLHQLNHLQAAESTHNKLITAVVHSGTVHARHSHALQV